MDSLFYQLTLNAKTKRWLILLDILEQTEEVTATSLVKQTQFSRRTIMKDIKTLKEYFGNTIRIIGDEKGYHFSFIDPERYHEQKQDLLSEEKLFFFIDQLAKGKQIENEQWRAYLAIPAGSFHRIKHHFQGILAKNYGCQLVTKYNQLEGEEASIRQFFYDFYFTMPIYPPALSKHVNQLQKILVKVESGQWRLDQTLFNQWLHIANLRIFQGYTLPGKDTLAAEQEVLVQALNQQVPVFLPDREKAALFLLALDDRQFLNPLVQQAFIQKFSFRCTWNIDVLSTDELVYHLFETFFFLMESFFQLPQQSDYQVDYIKLDKQVLLEGLLDRFRREKDQYNTLLYVTYQLEGPVALKRWIQKEVTSAFQKVGFQAIEAPISVSTGMGKHVQVTNCILRQTAKNTIQLPKIPNKKNIQWSVNQYL